MDTSNKNRIKAPGHVEMPMKNRSARVGDTSEKVSAKDRREIRRWLNNGMRDMGVEVWFRIAGPIWHDGKEQEWELKGFADEACVDLVERSSVSLREDESRGGIIDYPRIGNKYTHVLVWERLNGRKRAEGAEIDHLIATGSLVPSKLNVAGDMLEEVPVSVNRRRGGEQLRAVRAKAGTLKSIAPGITPNKGGFVVDGAREPSQWATTKAGAESLRSWLKLQQDANEERDWDAIGGRPEEMGPDVVFSGPDSTKQMLDHLRKTGAISDADARRSLKRQEKEIKEYNRQIKSVNPPKPRKSSLPPTKAAKRPKKVA